MSWHYWLIVMVHKNFSFLTTFFAEIEKPTLKLMWNLKAHWIAKNKTKHSKKKNQVGRHTDFKTYYTTTVIETVVLVKTDMDWWNRLESPEINCCIYYGPMIFDKGAKTLQWGKDSLLNDC